MNSPGYDASQLHSNDDGSVSGSNRKRKATGSSGRGVASLTPEQLAKKRANDREAQRAIRERTKNTIETLERRIHELTSQQPYQELQSIIRQKEAVQAENEEIRRRLASAVSILQPILGSQNLADLAQAAQHNVHAVLAPSVSPFQPDQYMNGTAASRPLTTSSTTIHQTPTEQTGYPSPFPSHDQDPTTEGQAWQSSRTALSNQRETMHRSHELSQNGEKLNFSFLIESNPSSQGKSNEIPSIPDRRTSPSNLPIYQQIQDTSSSNQQAWNMLPKNCPPTCPLDNILLNFLQARQREVAGYTPGSGRDSAYSSPAYPSISNLLNPSNTTTSAGTASPGLSRHIPSTNSSTTSRPDPLSTLMTDIISKFPNISGLPEQVATTYLMFLFMRWQIYPTPENYHRLPEWMVPRPLQLFAPHPAWMDHLPQPRMRDRLVQDYQSYPFENWFLPFTSGLSVNWPYEQTDCLLATQEGGDPIINPVFERHIFRLENWSVGPQFVEAYPNLADTVNVRVPERKGDASVMLDNDQMPQGLSTLNHNTGLSMHDEQQAAQSRHHLAVHQQGHGPRSSSGNDVG